MTSHTAIFRFYEELNDFLPPEKRKRDFEYRFNDHPSVKDAIESLGAPHVEVDLILVNGVSVDFRHRLKDGDRVSVYPVFESLDITGVTHLRERPLREPSFILDVHLGRLAKYLRMLGFDTLYRNDFTGYEIIDIAIQSNRTILTRNTNLLKMKSVSRGYAIRSSDPYEQIREVVGRFDLRSSARPFTRCIDCNCPIESVSKENIADRLEELTSRYYKRFFICTGCGKIYWEGSHYERMMKMIEKLS